MTSYLLLKPLKIDQVEHRAGEVVPIRDGLVDWLDREGVISKAGDQTAPQIVPTLLKPAPPAAKPARRSGCRGCGWK